MAFSSYGLFHATPTAVYCGIIFVRGLILCTILAMNLHPHEQACVYSFINHLKGIIYLLPTIYVPMNQQNMLYPRTLTPTI
jgi:hypothetical protein